MKEPRLTPSLNKRNLAFSSYFSCFSATFSARMSINKVSSCVLVKWLFFVSIFTIGSSVEVFIHFWAVSLNFNLFTSKAPSRDTVLYTGLKEKICARFLCGVNLKYVLHLYDECKHLMMSVFAGEREEK